MCKSNRKKVHLLQQRIPQSLSYKRHEIRRLTVSWRKVSIQSVVNFTHARGAVMENAPFPRNWRNCIFKLNTRIRVQNCTDRHSLHYVRLLLWHWQCFLLFWLKIAWTDTLVQELLSRTGLLSRDSTCAAVALSSPRKSKTAQVLPGTEWTAVFTRAACMMWDTWLTCSELIILYRARASLSWLHKLYIFWGQKWYHFIFAITLSRRFTVNL